jgi:hypothetical protein
MAWGTSLPVLVMRRLQKGPPTAANILWYQVSNHHASNTHTAFAMLHVQAAQHLGVEDAAKLFTDDGINKLPRDWATTAVVSTCAPSRVCAVRVWANCISMSACLENSGASRVPSSWKAATSHKVSWCTSKETSLISTLTPFVPFSHPAGHQGVHHCQEPHPHVLPRRQQGGLSKRV